MIAPDASGFSFKNLACERSRSETGLSAGLGGRGCVREGEGHSDQLDHHLEIFACGRANHAPGDDNGTGNPRCSREERILNLLRYSGSVISVQLIRRVNADDAGRWTWRGSPGKVGEHG